MRRRWFALAVVIAVAEARAAPDDADLDEAPPPGAESGRVDTPSDGSSIGRDAANVVLFLPRAAVELLTGVIRGGIVLDDRLHVSNRILGWYFGKGGGTVGLVPLVYFESTVGGLVGAQLQVSFNHNNALEVFGGIGLSSRRRADLEYRTNGHLGGRLGFTLRGDYDARPEARFYGIGNGDLIETPPAPIDAFDRNVATKSLYTDKLARAAAAIDFRLVDSTFVDISGAYSDRRRDIGSEGPLLEKVFIPNPQIDFDDYRSAYAELGLRYDTRDARSIWEPSQLDSRGSLVSVYGGLETLDPGTSFVRYGFDAQHYTAIGSGPRVLMVRLQGEAITAAAEQVPFPELPSLGDRARLRGYPLDRFRDRVAAVGTGEYEWALSRYVFASLFVDVGRVYPSPDELSFDDLRCGFGLGLEAHTRSRFLARASVASSIDGGVFFNLYFQPVYSFEPRVRRK